MSRRKVNENDKWSIPDDWTESDGYQLLTLCVPNSRQWRGILRGQISSLSYGRNWNKNSGTIVVVQELAREIEETMTINCLADITEALQCICAQMEAQTVRGSATETEVDIPPSNGEISVGPGEQFPTQGAYYNAKCSAANGVYDTALGAIDWMDNNVEDLLSGLFSGITTGMTAGFLAAGPLGWGVMAAAATMSALAALTVRYDLNFSDVSDALGEQHDECVKALYNAANSSLARSNFLTELDNAATSITPLARKFVSYLLSNSVLNQLFDIGDDVVSYNSPDPVVCDTFLFRWPFILSGESWLFRNDSTGAYSASGAWNSSAEAWRIGLTGPGTGTGPRAEGTVYLTGLSIVVGVGNSVQFDHSATSDEVVGSRKIKAIFSDATEQFFSAPSTATAGTAIMSIEASKTIEELEVGLGRNWSNPFDITRDVNEVRVV